MPSRPAARAGAPRGFSVPLVEVVWREPMANIVVKCTHGKRLCGELGMGLNAGDYKKNIWVKSAQQ